jgi:hypothetical protein
MTSDGTVSAFKCLRAVQAGDVEAAREFAGAEPRMPEPRVGIVERIMITVTALPGPARRQASRAKTPSSWRLSGSPSP